LFLFPYMIEHVHEFFTYGFTSGPAWPRHRPIASPKGRIESRVGEDVVHPSVIGDRRLISATGIMDNLAPLINQQPTLTNISIITYRYLWIYNQH
jgi:hypothetical protein